jgi:hypothetical protein
MVNFLLADVPVAVGRDDARQAAAAELADPGYRAAEPSLLTKVLSWLSDRLQDLLNGISNVVPGGVIGLLVIIAVIIVLAVVIRLKVGKVGRAARVEHQVFQGRARPAVEYRRAAEAAAGRGDFGEAVRERFRAIVRALEERGLLDERSGRTADEAATDAGLVLPGCAAELISGARLFDDVYYGDCAATAEGYRRLAELDGRCASERPVALGVA